MTIEDVKVIIRGDETRTLEMKKTTLPQHRWWLAVLWYCSNHTEDTGAGGD